MPKKPYEDSRIITKKPETCARPDALLLQLADEGDLVEETRSQFVLIKPDGVTFTILKAEGEI